MIVKFDPASRHVRERDLLSFRPSVQTGISGSPNRKFDGHFRTFLRFFSQTSVTPSQLSLWKSHAAIFAQDHEYNQKIGPLSDRK